MCIRDRLILSLLCSGLNAGAQQAYLSREEYRDKVEAVSYTHLDVYKRQHYQELLNNDIPIVFYDRICTGLKTERVVVDDYAGSFAAVEYMIQTCLLYTSRCV